MDGKIVEILLVEDNEYDAELATNALKSRNLANNLLHVEDGVEALDFLFRKGGYSSVEFTSKPKVVLLDLKMPRVSGLEVLRRIKENEETREIPVVVLTSSKEESDIKEAYRLGANSYIVKPVGFENFIDAVVDLGMYWLILNNPPASL